MFNKSNFSPVPVLSHLGGGQRFIVGHINSGEKLIKLVFKEWDIEQGETVLEEKNALHLFAYLDKFLNGQLPQKSTRKISETLNCNRTEVYNRDVIKLSLSKSGVHLAESVIDIAEARVLRDYLKGFLGDA